MNPSDYLDNPHDVALRPSRLPLWAQRTMMGIFLLALAASALFAFTEHWRRATFSLGSALVWLAVVRLLCDSRLVGIFAVRSRRFDTLFSTLLGGSMAFLALSVDSLGS
ncbi:MULTISPECIES: DUF3017 domain-containing protein [unclassified Corynebacterium]|uniref:DUF3017 domain-containing protein n=1 Tax=unclassified Corynebacterium TaxID=2624378 RepID=UPI0029C9B61A|nr:MULTISPECIES: DUF3017 domain-containing protein [unclassified Corynebacterium]WPF66579.1 DUF3017 domain-containing protein [Corynebacterium sp. 22KM0430]WPF69068.1 DUF3017 domain-containing protein [Corynebacterium sp. 21KM1197]